MFRFLENRPGSGGLLADVGCAALLGVAAFLSAGPSQTAAQCVEGCVAIHTLQGEAAGDTFGWEVTVLGDVNADGVDDFVISAPLHNVGAAADVGRVYAYSGASGALLWTRNGTAAGGQFGFSISVIGDWNNDGKPDVFVGQPGAGNGVARVLSGVTGATLASFAGEAFADLFGYRATGGEDVNADGVDDLLVGAPRHDAGGVDAGRVYVISGADASVLCTMDGEAPGDELGTALTFLGDRDGDGRAEVVACAKDAGPALGGRAYVYSYARNACALIAVLAPPPGAVDFGQFMASGRQDVDGDRVPDLYVGDFVGNRAYIYSGATLELLHLLQGDGNGQFGVGRLGPDINLDGHADIITAAWLSNAAAPLGGKVFVYSGKDASVLETLTHATPNATFGFDAAILGDVNGDGRSDYVITAASDLNSRGVVYVIAGGVTPAGPVLKAPVALP